MADIFPDMLRLQALYQASLPPGYSPDADFNKSPSFLLKKYGMLRYSRDVLPKIIMAELVGIGYLTTDQATRFFSFTHEQQMGEMEFAVEDEENMMDFKKKLAGTVVGGSSSTPISAAAAGLPGPLIRNVTLSPRLTRASRARSLTYGGLS